MFEWLQVALYRIAAYLGKTETISPSGVISGTDLFLAVQRDLKPDKVYISDSSFQTVGTEGMKVLLTKDTTNFGQYISEDFDCDDFSYMLMGNMRKPDMAPHIAFGIIWVWWYNQTPIANKVQNIIGKLVTGNAQVFQKTISGHALNCYYDSDKKKMMIVEPQNDGIQEIPSHWHTTVVMI